MNSLADFTEYDGQTLTGDSRRTDSYITGVDSYQDACMMINFYNQTRAMLGW